MLLWLVFALVFVVGPYFLTGKLLPPSKAMKATSIMAFTGFLTYFVAFPVVFGLAASVAGQIPEPTHPIFPVVGVTSSLVTEAIALYIVMRRHKLSKADKAKTAVF
jgi:Na+-driven multidrug efflux pump